MEKLKLDRLSQAQKYILITDKQDIVMLDSSDNVGCFQN